jgi:hypothetical protein
MRRILILLSAVAIVAHVLNRKSARGIPPHFQQLQGWQKLLGLVAMILALLIILNPEFLALGLVGDAAFFDVLVLLLSLQFQTIAARAWHCVCALSSTVGRMLIARMSLSFVAIAVALAPIGTVVAAIRKALQNGS